MSARSLDSGKWDNGQWITEIISSLGLFVYCWLLKDCQVDKPKDRGGMIACHLERCNFIVVEAGDWIEVETEGCEVVNSLIQGTNFQYISLARNQARLLADALGQSRPSLPGFRSGWHSLVNY